MGVVLIGDTLDSTHPRGFKLSEVTDVEQLVGKIESIGVGQQNDYDQQQQMQGLMQEQDYDGYDQVPEVAAFGGREEAIASLFTQETLGG